VLLGSMRSALPDNRSIVCCCGMIRPNATVVAPVILISAETAGAGENAAAHIANTAAATKDAALSLSLPGMKSLTTR
jgi:hypothetical protein